MLCQKCHKNLASVRYAEVVDGAVADLHLCQECMDLRQASQGTGFDLAEPSPFSRTSPRSAVSRAMASAETCDSCSTDLKSIIETGKVGCSACYDTFPAQLESVLEGIHSAMIHRGKSPQVDDARARLHSGLQSKRALLKTALSLENYEEAATLRDEIQAVEIELGIAEVTAE